MVLILARPPEPRLHVIRVLIGTNQEENRESGVPVVGQNILGDLQVRKTRPALMIVLL
jgi:hypothetical protein